MNQPAGMPRFLRELFPTASEELTQLCAAAAAEGGLLHNDFFTVRDLLDVSGYDHEALHALLLVMLLALDGGSICVELAEPSLVRHLADWLDPQAAARWARRILQCFHKDGFPALIGPAECIDRPIVQRASTGRTFLYFQKYLHHESRLRELVRSRLDSVPTDNDLPRLAAILREVLVEQPAQPTGQPLPLNRAQRLALGVALLRRFAIISGGPGTGKTSVVFTLARCLLRTGIPAERILLAAPTGRAAQRLTDSLRAGLAGLPSCESAPDAALAQLSANTLHGLLGYEPGRDQFRHHSENPLAADAVIVDEVSMVGLRVAAQLFQATEPDTRIILLGDKDQLPAVDVGAILTRLMPARGRPGFSPQMRQQLATILPGLGRLPDAQGQSFEDVLVVLEENYRSRQDIQDFARAINHQDTAVIERLPRFVLPAVLPTMDVAADAPARGTGPPGSLAELEKLGGCWLMDSAPMSLADWRRMVRRWVDHHYLTTTSSGASYVEIAKRLIISAAPSGETQEAMNQLFSVLNRARILTLIREGTWGCIGINRMIAAHVQSRLGWRASGELFAGAPLLVCRNDHARGLYNGDVGLALKTAQGSYRAVFSRQDGYLTMPVESLPAHELAFALTVHKSQGSEYGQVLLVLPPEGGRRLLTREVIYTGITRARDLALLCGPTEVLRQAIGRSVPQEDGFWNREPEPG